MSKHPKSIQRSIQIAVQRPHTGIELLANTFTKCIDSTTWVTKDLKIEFCLLFLNAILENTNRRDNTDLSNKLQNRSIHLGIRLLKSYPQEGLKVLVELIINELINNQCYSQDDLIKFYAEVFSRFFPEMLSSNTLSQGNRLLAGLELETCRVGCNIPSTPRC